MRRSASLDREERENIQLGQQRWDGLHVHDEECLLKPHRVQDIVLVPPFRDECRQFIFLLSDIHNLPRTYLTSIAIALTVF